MKNIFIKASGDILDSRDFLDFVEEQTEFGFVVLCVGGGTKINDVFKEHGYPVLFDPRHGRKTESFEQRRLARQVLEDIQRTTQNTLRGVGVTVITPIVDVGSILADVHADLMVDIAYNSFDEIFVCTVLEKIEEKREKFEEHKKVTVYGF